MKSRTEFSQEKITTIKTLISNLKNSNSEEQKKIRRKIRELGFYISDFKSTSNNENYTVAEFNNLIKNGIIKVIGKSTYDFNKVQTKSRKQADQNTISKHNLTANNAIKSSDIDSPRYDFNTKPKELVKANKNHNTDFKSGLEPWVGGEPKVLILGSLPGDESIKQQAYYANKGNAFWKIMRALYNNNTETDNKKFIISCGIALWDCVHSAVRKGSLDSAIKDDSVVANDIRGLIAKYPTINTIILNGDKAEKLYNKYCKGIDCPTIRLISTSPAATIVFEEKLQKWSIVKDMTK